MEVVIDWSSSCGDYSDNRKRMQQMVSRANVPQTMASATQLTAPEQRELEWESRWEQWKLESDARWEKRKLELLQQSDARWERSMQQLRNMIFPKPIGEVTVADKESSFASPLEEVDLQYKARRQQSEARFHERRADTDPQTFIPLPQVEGQGFDSLVSHEEGEQQPIPITTLVQIDESLGDQREKQKSTSYLVMENSDAELERIVAPRFKGNECGVVFGFSDYVPFPDSQQLKNAESLPTTRPNASVREMTVILPISVYYCVPLWMFIWYPKPMVKMKLEEVAQEVWSHDSLKARNIKLSTKHGCLVSNRSTMEVKQESHKEQMSYANFSMIDNTWKERKDEMVKKFDGLSKVVKDVLSDKVEKVIVSDRVEDFPCCLVVRECRWTDNMERIVKADSSMADSSMAWCISSTNTMELNPEKPMEELRKRADYLKKRVYLGSFYQNFMGLVTKVMKMKFLTSLANWIFDGGGFNRAIYIDALVEGWFLASSPKHVIPAVDGFRNATNSDNIIHNKVRLKLTELSQELQLKGANKTPSCQFVGGLVVSILAHLYCATSLLEAEIFFIAMDMQVLEQVGTYTNDLLIPKTGLLVGQKYGGKKDEDPLSGGISFNGSFCIDGCLEQLVILESLCNHYGCQMSFYMDGCLEQLDTLEALFVKVDHLFCYNFSPSVVDFGPYQILNLTASSSCLLLPCGQGSLRGGY